MTENKFYDTKETEYFKWEREEMLQFLPNNLVNVLEIGCSVGNFAQLVKKKYNCKVYGIEPHKESAEVASKKIDYVFNQNFERNIDFGTKFDCIILNDVIEHIYDTNDTLNICKEYLNTNGCIVLSIPNFRYITNLIEIIAFKDFKYKEDGILDKTHLRFFTKKSMIRTIKNNSFKINKIDGVNSIYKFSKLYYIAFLLINILTLGYMNDCQYLQYGLNITPKMD